MSFLSDPITFIGQWLTNLLLGWGLAPGLVGVITRAIGAFVLAMTGLMLVVFTIIYERKLYGRIQDRLGPNRIGPWGLLQTIPDMIKIFTKEYITPEGADKIPYNLAPILSVVGVLMVWAVLPLAKTIFGTDIDVGVLYIVGVGAIGELGIILAGWASNNKYALLGAFRAVAQVVSFEVPMVLALLVPVILGGTMGVNSLVQAQDVWFIVFAPVAALIFFISSQAEVGRAPFDLLEAESEIVSGFQIEYSGLKFGWFFVGEFLHAFTISALTATLFFGGWRGPGAQEYPILGLLYFFVKSMIIYLVVILMRIALPRLRIDQMLNLNWKVLTPLALAAVMLTAVVEKVVLHYAAAFELGSTAATLLRASAHLLANALLLAVFFGLVKQRTARREPPLVGRPRPVAVPPAAPAPPAVESPHSAMP